MKRIRLEFANFHRVWVARWDKSPRPSKRARAQYWSCCWSKSSPIVHDVDAGEVIFARRTDRYGSALWGGVRRCMHSVLHEVVEHLDQASPVCRDNAVRRSLADDLNTLGCFFLRPRRGCGRAQIVQRDSLTLKLNRSGKVEETADDCVETVDLFEDHRAAPFSRFGISGALPHLRPHPDGAERIA